MRHYLDKFVYYFLQNIGGKLMSLVQSRHTKISNSEYLINISIIKINYQ